MASSIVRDPAFAARLAQACDSNFHCPDGRGRLTWVSQELKRRFHVENTVPTVARWFNGEAKPRRDTNARLAELLGVDDVWLYMGVNHDVGLREKRIRDAEVDGIVNVVAGFIQMDGGAPAFPLEDDERARSSHIDIYAVIKGANYALHISLGEKYDEGWRFSMPIQNDNVINLGVIRAGMSIRIVEITEDLAAQGQRSKGLGISVVLDDAVVEQNQVQDFTRRL